MRINRPKSIEMAKAVHAKYGSWKAAQDAAQYVDGKYVLSGFKRFTDVKAKDIDTDTRNATEGHTKMAITAYQTIIVKKHAKLTGFMLSGYPSDKTQKVKVRLFFEHVSMREIEQAAKIVAEACSYTGIYVMGYLSDDTWVFVNRLPESTVEFR